MTITPAEQVGQAALSGFAQYESQIAELKRQLAESQAREARLMEALEYYRVNGHHEQSYNLACSAIALQHDDTALKEYRDAVIDGLADKLNSVAEYEERVRAEFAGWIRMQSATWNGSVKPVCQTCKGRGVIGGFVSIEAGYQDDPCPECSATVIDAPEASELNKGGA